MLKLTMLGLVLLVLLLTVSANGDGRSLVFVFDTTGSMGSELTQVKAGGRRILQAALDNPQRDWRDFILVPFNDPEVGPETITDDKDVFAAALEGISVAGGGDCPESCIGGIQKGLEVSRPDSYIFVFTDADAKDHHLTDQVIETIQEKKSKVIFIMTGSCASKTGPGYTAYTRIASASSGQVFDVGKGNVEEVLDAVIETTIEGPDVGPIGNSTIGDANIYSIDIFTATSPSGDIVVISIDSFITDLTISLSGQGPSIAVYDPAGHRPPDSQLTITLSLSNVIMIKIVNPAPGNWTLNYTSTSAHSLRVRGISTADFEPRYSVTHFGVHFNSTSTRPIAGVPVYAVVRGSGFENGGSLVSVDIVSANGTVLFTRTLRSIDDVNHVYITSSSFGFPDGLFFVKVTGTDKEGHIFIRTSHSAVSTVEAKGYEECKECSTDGTSQCTLISDPVPDSVSDAKFLCQCKTPYFSGDGKTCIDVDECSLGIDNCHEQAGCTNTIGGYSCDCNPGWAGNGLECSSVNECLLGTHNCHGSASCTDTRGSFSCACNAGFVGDGVSCADINECSTGGHACDTQREVCVNTHGGHSCVCAGGYVHDGSACVDVDECAATPGPCNPSTEVCNNEIGTYNCSCATGYFFDGDECADIDECSLDEHSCNEITEACQNTPGGHECVCATGYYRAGVKCTDIDECTADVSPCNAVTEACLNAPGTFRCLCARGYTREDGVCVDIDECRTGEHDCVASQNEECSNTVGEFECVCIDGYHRQGSLCQDIDECSADPSPCNETTEVCRNSPGSYRCLCSAGYARENAGAECEDVDECTLGRHKCDAVTEVCVNSVGRYECECASGYALDGWSCTDVNECASNLDSCDRVREECVNTLGAYNCACARGYSREGDVCEDIDECAGDHTCDSVSEVCRNLPGTFNCVCAHGYSLEGSDCVDINECVAGLNPCNPTTEVCKNTIGAHLCLCASGYTRVDGICEDVNECALGRDNCNTPSEVCINVPGSFNCSCAVGYQREDGVCLVSCGGSYEGTEGELQSPSYPEFYSNNADCRWSIHVSEGFIEIEFVDFLTEQSPDCDFDYLKITNDETGLEEHKLCGEYSGKISVYSKRVTLQFVSDGSVGQRGFKIKWKRVYGGSFTQKRGIIKSPNYPEVYPNLLYVSWNITVPEGHKIKIDVEEFDVEYGTFCEYDSLSFLNGYTHAKIGDNYCGTEEFHLLIDSNKVEVNFISDSSVSALGWVLQYEGVLP